MAKGASAFKKDEMKNIIEFGLSEIIKLEGGTKLENLDAIIENSYST